MKFNRIMLAAASAAALSVPFSSSVQAAATQPMINGKPCTPVPGGSSKLGIQLYSIPGLLTGTATTVEQASDMAIATAAARTATAGAAGGAGRGAGGAGRGAAGAGGAAGPGAPGGARGGAAGAAAGGRGGAGAAGGAARPAPSLPDGSGANVPLVDSTFAWLKSIGFNNVERAGYYALSPAQLKAALAKAGLTDVGGHDTISANGLDMTIDYAVQSGQKTFVGAAGWQYGSDMNADGVKVAADGLNAAGQKALAAGLHLYVHNHTQEFTPVMYDINHDGKPIMVPAIEALMDQTDPRYVNFEIDIHWIIEAYMGAPYNQAPAQAEQTALAFVKKHAARIPLYHVKETNPAADGGEGYMGQGITHWDQWWAADPNIQYYIYEMDTAPTGGKVKEYAETAANYLLCKS